MTEYELMNPSWFTPVSIFTPAQRAEIVRVVREALKRDPSILREAVMALQADEGKRQEAAVRSAIGLAHDDLLRDPGDGIAGNPSGATAIVEFYDIRCPYCRHMEPVVQQLLHDHPELRLVYKELPVLGPASRLGARAMLAAARQGGYLALHAKLMRSPAPTDESLKRDAEAAGLDWQRLQRDMADPAIQRKIQANLGLARHLGIEGTPAFVIGNQLIPGEVELADLERAIGAAPAGR
jgi:protein-disulfide isomerase